jgi:hypothetical protein
MALPAELLNQLFEEMQNDANLVPDPVFASNRQKGFMNYRGVEPEVYIGGFKDKMQLNNTIGAAVKFANNFGKRYKDADGKPMLPASGENHRNESWSLICTSFVNGWILYRTDQHCLLTTDLVLGSNQKEAEGTFRPGIAIASQRFETTSILSSRTHSISATIKGFKSGEAISIFLICPALPAQSISP